eukprot:TRINITY_DN42298_c0_g1_i1.p1 TRINITY_DN42298_c0_g1~~TRINITY_DN42298_c0_g1_i1.p1  ORF type:complete len:1574 (+),score=246.40 TRINITY_DN42298_c0_g1_i1:385-4722(+)
MAGGGEGKEMFEQFRQFLGACVAETLPKGQDAALSALAVYLEHCPGIENEDSGYLVRLMRSLVEHKSIDKPKMQQLVPPIVLIVAEICECSVVVKELIDIVGELEAAKKKTLGFFKKQVAFIIKLLYQLLADFGDTKINPRLGYLPLVAKYAADSDRGIKEACYSVLLELFAWVGDVTELSKSLEEPQKKELTKRIAELEGTEQEPRQAKRVYRNERRVRACASEEGVVEATPQADVCDVPESVDALKQLPRGWCISKVLTMEKWKQKQLHLQEFASCLDVSRIVPSETYISMVPTLVRLIKHESNIPLVTEVAKCMGLLAKGLREHFERGARQLLPVALARINDKTVWKQNILIERVEQLLWSVPFDIFFEEIRQYVVNKSHFAKKEAMSLLLRALDLPQVLLSCPDVVERYYPFFVSAAVPNLDDADNGTRQESAKFLANISLRNISFPEIGRILADKIPTNRRSVFEDEWRKIAKDQPCPVSSMDSTGSGRRPITPRAGVSAAGTRGPSVSRVVPAGGGGSRQASPRRERPGSSSPSHRTARLAAPVVERSAVDSTYSVPEGVDVADVMAVHAEMAQEIRSLRSAVQQLQSQTTASTGDLLADANPHIATVNSQIRVPSGERASRPSTRAHSRQDRTLQGPGQGPGMVRPTTPPRQMHASHGYSSSARPTTPQRIRPNTANGYVTTPARDNGNRRSSVPSAGNSPRGTSTEMRNKVRPASSDAIRRRDGAARGGAVGGPSLRRSNSSGPFGLPGVATGVVLRIEYPSVSKAMRQQRERGQYWGPQPIPSEYLAAHKDAWRACVDERLMRGMFCDKMDEQLAALNIWKEQGRSHFGTLPEILDMLIKYLTWLLFSTNTQIWKLVLEVLTILMDGVAATGLQLTEREIQILIPNLLERSGHNIGSIREGMCALLRRAVAVSQRIRVLPMVLAGLSSKNKRSVACAMRTLGDCLDRQVASSLVRSQRDFKLVACGLEDKDADLRYNAVKTVAQLSRYIDRLLFEKLLKSLSAAAQSLVRAAAAGLVPVEDAGHNSFDASVVAAELHQENSVPPAAAEPEPYVTSRTEECAQVISPVAQRSRRPQSPARVRPMYSPRESGDAASGYVVAGTGVVADVRAAVGRLSDAEVADTTVGKVRTSLLSLPEVSAPVQELVDRMGQCSAEQFKETCTSLREHAKRMADGDAPAVAEALVSAMRMYFGHDGCVERCWPLAELVDEFCASRECIRPLPTDLLRGLLRELMRNLHSNAWTQQLDMGEALLKKLNLSCVLLLQSITRQLAISLLLSLGTDESEVVGSTLAVKCLKKLTKTLVTCKRPEQEVPDILEVLRLWMQRAQPRLDRSPSGGDKRASGAVDAVVATVLEGVRAVAEAACRACPASARSWKANLNGEAHGLLLEWLASQEGAREKENASSVTPKAKEVAAPSKRTVSSPHPVGSPCATRNTSA